MLAFVGLTWGIVVLGSLIGWGAALERLLGLDKHTGWGLRATLGSALSVAVGGVLNLTWEISPTTVLIYLAAGLGMLACDAALKRPPRIWPVKMADARAWIRSHPVQAGVVAVTVGLLLVRYLGSAGGTFNADDDFQAYLVFPKRMLQTGSLGADPFNGRRIEAGLNAQAFLDTFVLSVLPEADLHVLDPGLGRVIASGALFGVARSFAIPHWATGVLVPLVLFLPVGVANVTPELLMVAQLLCLFWLLLSHSAESGGVWRRAVAVALVGVALCAEKSSLAPAVGLACVAAYSVRLSAPRKRQSLLTEASLAGVCALALIAPWMLSVAQSSGTLLFPILGRGFHGSVYGNFPLPSDGASISDLMATVRATLDDPLLRGLAVCASICALVVRTGKTLWLALAVGEVVATFVVRFSFLDFPATKYSLPFLLATLLIGAMLVIRDVALVRHAALRRLAPIGFVIGCCGLLTVVAAPNPPTDQLRQDLHNFRLAEADYPSLAQVDANTYSELQGAAPEGAAIFVRLDRPDLLDFRRNVLFIADHPGQASPPPGLPIFQGPQAIAHYLLNHAIRFVAYSYANEAGFTRSSALARQDVSAPRVVRTTAQNVLAFEDAVDQLVRTRVHVYDDGSKVLLDLDQARANIDPSGL